MEYWYKYGQCNATYWGETICHFKTCIAEHKQISVHTGRPLRTTNSVISEHSLNTGLPIIFSNFKANIDKASEIYNDKVYGLNSITGLYQWIQVLVAGGKGTIE